MKNLFSVLAIALVLGFVATADAQRPAGQRGGPPPGRNQENVDNQDQQLGNQFGNQAAQNQNVNQNMPSVAQLAQMMIASFDANGSGELSQAELQSALTALGQMMQNQAGGQDQADQQQNGFANQQSGFQGRQDLQDNQAQGNRPPPPRRQAGFQRGQ